MPGTLPDMALISTGAALAVWRDWLATLEACNHVRCRLGWCRHATALWLAHHQRPARDPRAEISSTLSPAARVMPPFCAAGRRLGQTVREQQGEAYWMAEQCNAR